MPRILMNPRTKKFEIENREVEVDDELKIYIEKLENYHYGVVALDQDENFIVKVKILHGAEELEFAINMKELEFADLVSTSEERARKFDRELDNLIYKIEKGLSRTETGFASRVILTDAELEICQFLDENRFFSSFAPKGIHENKVAFKLSGRELKVILTTELG
jgi:hypothetical protein